MTGKRKQATRSTSVSTASVAGCGESRFFKARSLCETCWAYAKIEGSLHQFPSVYESKNERENPGRFCPCFNPVIDPMPTWNTSQCLKCGREIRK